MSRPKLIDLEEAIYAAEYMIDNSKLNELGIFIKRNNKWHIIKGIYDDNYNQKLSNGENYDVFNNIFKTLKETTTYDKAVIIQNSSNDKLIICIGKSVIESELVDGIYEVEKTAIKKAKNQETTEVFADVKFDIDPIYYNEEDEKEELAKEEINHVSYYPFGIDEGEIIETSLEGILKNVPKTISKPKEEVISMLGKAKIGQQEDKTYNWTGAIIDYGTLMEHDYKYVDTSDLDFDFNEDVIKQIVEKRNLKENKLPITVINLNDNDEFEFISGKNSTEEIYMINQKSLYDGLENKNEIEFKRVNPNNRSNSLNPNESKRM